MSGLTSTPVTRALELARWAPSADNSQPWRFQIIDETSVRIYAKHNPDNPNEMHIDTAILIPLGMLIETLAIAASHESYQISWEYKKHEHNQFIVLVRLTKADIQQDLLFDYISTRSVNRKPMKLQKLSAELKIQLQACLNQTGIQITWHEGWRKKLYCSYLNGLGTRIRLAIPETFHIHQTMLEWDTKTSPDKLPIDTLPYDTLTKLLVRWALRSWKRYSFLSKYFAGFVMPIVEGDYHPGLRCAAHFTLHTQDLTSTPEDVMRYGRFVQRIWLTATSLGLTIQPNYAPIIFSHHSAKNLAFTQLAWAHKKAAELKTKLEQFKTKEGIAGERMIFWGRIGYPYPQKKVCRSVRLSLQELIIQ